MTIDFANYTVLVADDSRLVCSSISSHLKKNGVEHVDLAYRASEAIGLCKSKHYDLIVCDYNFHSELNGYQILDELKYYRYLQADTVFMFLTGENDPKIVRSILDSEPDDYLLKPLNMRFFLKRLQAAANKKAELLPIYQHLFEQDYKRAVVACDALIAKGSKYIKLIRKYKAQSLIQLKQFNLARSEYEILLKADDFDWIKTSLANTLIETNQMDKALVVLDSVADKQANPYYHDEMSNIAALDNQLPQAIDHLKKSTMLLDAGAERDLVIANLSLAVQSYDDALSYIKRYYDKNIHTFRGGDYTKINYLRCFLYKFTDHGDKKLFDHYLECLKTILFSVSKNENLGDQYQLILAHIDMINHDYHSAINKVKRALPNIQDFHFYDLFHLCFLLERFSFFNEVKYLLPQCRRAINREQHASIFRSQVLMLNALEQRLHRTQQAISGLKDKIVRRGKVITKNETNACLDDYLGLHDLSPTSKKLCLSIVQFIAKMSAGYQGKYDVSSKLEQCHLVMTKLYSVKELRDLNYLPLYQAARAKFPIAEFEQAVV